MLFSRDYRKPFWHGLFHALLVVVYVLFLALIVSQLNYLFRGEVGEVIRYAFGLFLAILSTAMCAWLIFYEPVKYLFHHHFKAATVMLLSTLGWLFIFLVIFIFGLVFSLVA